MRWWIGVELLPIAQRTQGVASFVVFILTLPAQLTKGDP
jgi:hypothetical protein